MQRVSSASVTAGEHMATIGPGLAVLLGVRRDDDAGAAERMVRKLLALRVFADEEGRMNRSVRDTGGEILCVSNFTLYGDVRRGLRPSFTEAAEPPVAGALYDVFCRELEARSVHVETGHFGARMTVSLKNEGPVTMMVET